MKFCVAAAEAAEGLRLALPILRGDKTSDGSVCCWWCGTEPDSLIDVTRLGSAVPEYLPDWPPMTDHEHADRPPTPAELERAGHQALARIYSSACR